MTFNEYQKLALTTLHSPTKDNNDFMHRLLGVAGETGEFIEKCKKVYRDNNGEFTKDKIDEITQEMGDILWYIAVLADYFDVPLEDIVDHNVARLKDRKARGKIQGSGDNR